MPDLRGRPSVSNASLQYDDDHTLSEMLNKLKVDSKAMMTILLKQFKDLRNDFKNNLEAKDKEIEILQHDLQDVRKTVRKLEDSIDDQNAYERRDTIIISGSHIPKATTGENCSDIVRQLIKEKLKIELPPSEVNTVHRLGTKSPSQAEDKRPFIMKLCRRDTKRQLIIAARSQNSSSQIYVNESLTPKRRTILYALRQMKKLHPTLVTGCNSIDGRIYAFTKAAIEGGRHVRHLVNTHEALVEFSREFVNKPLVSFLNEWVH